MEEPHIAKYKQSRRRSIYPPRVHSSASTPLVPYSTDSPQSPRTSLLKPTKIKLLNLIFNL